MNSLRTGVIDVGGGMRDIYGAGVFDYCMEHSLTFDICFGVSAGSANLSAFLAGQKGRNYRFYTKYAFRKEYMSIGNWMKNRNYVDLDYIYGTLSNSDGEDPVDYSAAMENPAEFIIVVTDALTGMPYYFDKTDLKQDDYAPIKASSCVPVANKPYFINGTPYFDGGLSDPIPLKKCLEAGCEKTVLILTRPKDFRRLSEKDRFSVRLLRKKYPEAARSLEKRAFTYNAALDEVVELEKEGKVLIVAPDDIGEMKTLTRDKDVMDRLYRKGLKDAEKIVSFMEEP